MHTIWGQSELQAANLLIDLAFQEDFSTQGDLTTQALISPNEQACVSVVVRKPGIVCGLPIGERVFAKLDSHVKWQPLISDGTAVSAGTIVATATGSVCSLLTGERTVLNFLTALSGVATLTGRYVAAVSGTKAVVLDTRKTWPGWRILQKYAVRCGGGANHRMGLFDGVLIKDNHLAAWTEHATLSEAVSCARKSAPAGIPIEVEVDTLEQLRSLLSSSKPSQIPEMVLLDNMPLDQLREAVAMRNRLAPAVLLEASGGVTLETISAIAKTGVDRISCGALTHSAVALDLAFDWGNSLKRPTP